VLGFEGDNSAESLLELYRVILVETPVARYFERYFATELKTDQPSRELQRAMNEAESDLITNMLQKLWLEDFYKFCIGLGGETAIIMKELLEFEADRKAISIVINSFEAEASEALSKEAERRAMFCSFGKLYPDISLQKLSKVGDMAALQNLIEPFAVYKNLFKRAESTGRSFIDCLYEYEVKLLLGAFMGQSHYACFYAFVKLKEREHANLKWILSCIAQKRDAKDLNRWIKIL